MPSLPETGPAAVFRSEAVEARRQSWIGGTRVPGTWLQTTMAIAASVSVVALLGVLTLCSYTRPDIATGFVAATRAASTDTACAGPRTRLEAVVALSEAQFRRARPGQSVSVSTTAAGHAKERQGCLVGVSHAALSTDVAARAFARPFNAPAYVARVDLPAGTDSDDAKPGVPARVTLGGERRRLYEWMLPAFERNAE